MQRTKKAASRRGARFEHAGAAADAGNDAVVPDGGRRSERADHVDHGSRTLRCQPLGSRAVRCDHDLDDVVEQKYKEIAQILAEALQQDFVPRLALPVEDGE